MPEQPIKVKACQWRHSNAARDAGEEDSHPHKSIRHRHKIPLPWSSAPAAIALNSRTHRVDYTYTGRYCSVMIAVQVRYFASLREQRGCDGETVRIEAHSTVRDLGQQLQLDVDGSDCMVAVNRVQATAAASIKDGDEVAFYPPVTGG